MTSENSGKTEKVDSQIRNSAVKSVTQRERLGQSPVPTHCILFDVRGEARESPTVTEGDIREALMTGSIDHIRTFELADAPDSEEELERLLSDDVRVRTSDGGWTLTDDE